MSEMINEELQGAVIDATPSLYGTPLGSLGSVSGLGSFGFHFCTIFFPAVSLSLLLKFCTVVSNG